MSAQPVLYTKTGCPWCAEARAVLDHRGLAYAEVCVTGNAAAMAEMVRLSTQTKAPVLHWAGEILADFGGAELGAFLDARPSAVLAGRPDSG